MLDMICLWIGRIFLIGITFLIIISLLIILISFLCIRIINPLWLSIKHLFPKYRYTEKDINRINKNIENDKHFKLTQKNKKLYILSYGFHHWKKQLVLLK